MPPLTFGLFKREGFLRLFFIILGWFMVALGVIGAFLPIMPTVPFLLVAAWAFAKSSPRFEAWILSHPTFGPPVKHWREEGAVPTRVKWIACSMMACGYGVALFLVSPPLWFALGLAAILLAVAVFLITRPTPKQDKTGQGS